MIPYRNGVRVDLQPVVDVVPDVLDRIGNQKGEARHGHGLRYEDQPIVTELRQLGPGGHVYQIRKKCLELLTNLERKGIEWAYNEACDAAAYLLTLIAFYLKPRLQKETARGGTTSIPKD